MDMFKRVVIEKHRFNTVKGLVDVEQLFDMPLKTNSGSGFDLNTVAKRIRREIDQYGDEDFVDGGNQHVRKVLEFKLDVVKEVIAYKQDRKKAQEDAAKRREEIRILEDALHIKTKEELTSMDKSAIESRLNELKKDV